MPETKDRLREALDAALAKLPVGPRVARIEIEEGLDSTGDPSLFLWILLTNDTPESEQTLAQLRPIEEAIRQAVRDLGEERWAYIRFRTEAEFEEFGEG